MIYLTDVFSPKMIKEELTIDIKILDIMNLTDEFKEEFKKELSKFVINIKHDDTVLILKNYLEIEVRKKFNPNVIYRKGDVIFYLNGLDCFKKFILR